MLQQGEMSNGGRDATRRLTMNVSAYSHMVTNGDSTYNTAIAGVGVGAQILNFHFFGGESRAH